MEKVDKEWFKAHGFSVEEYPEDGRTICMLVKDFPSGNRKLARWDYKHPNKDSNGFYQFYCSGNGFQVKNNISDEPFWDYQILSAMDVVGFNQVEDMSEYFQPLYDLIQKATGLKENKDIYEEFYGDEHELYVNTVLSKIPTDMIPSFGYEFGKWLNLFD